MENITPSGFKKPIGELPTQDLSIFVKSNLIPFFFQLLGQGFIVNAPANCSIRNLITDSLGIPDDYLEERIQTLFLNGNVVDDLNACIIKEGSTLALSGEEAVAVYTSDNDPELIREALPFGLKTYESLLASDPTSRSLHLTAAVGFISYARAFLEGRLTQQHLKNFRRELQTVKGPSSYPHPWLMPDFWQFPTVSMGLAPIMGIYQARFNRYLQDRKLAAPTDSKVWVMMGDGETDEPESLGAISLASREKLDNLIFVINANLQRLDGPVRGNGKIIQELESAFSGAGWNVNKVIWGDDWDPAKANVKGNVGRPSAVGIFPAGASPCGALDMSGNVWEWTLSQYQKYPYRNDGRNDPEADGSRTLRGGAWGNFRGYARVSSRNHYQPVYFDFNDGFRFVVAPV